MSFFIVKLFYSYCHADESHRVSMEKSLVTLRRQNLLADWHDRKITAGKIIENKIKDEMSQADIIAFLVSPDFLNSEACTEEWKMAKEMAKNGQKRLVPVIVRDCAWKDFDDMATRLALPTDGNPVSTWDNSDVAWQNVYTGLKDVIIDIRQNFNPKKEFIEQLAEFEFCTQYKEKIKLEDLFVFPVIYSRYKDRDKEELVKSENDVLQKKKILIRGDEQSGKTKLCCRLYSHLLNAGAPVLFADLCDIGHKKPNEDIYRRLYSEQFYGDYESWKALDNKAIIFDNLGHNRNNLEHIDFARENFPTIVLATSNDNYFAYFRDETKLADFSVLTLVPFTHAKQEELIKKWLKIREKNENPVQQIEYEKIDQIERNVNSIIINNKILPRFPFFILSILQVHEGFMPQNIQITAYGHCYYALILAHLIKSGIDKKDDTLEQCFNFLSHLAFEIYKEKNNPTIIDIEKYEDFIRRYKKDYVIADTILNRLNGPNGILKLNNRTRAFSVPYSYYFFLGRHLAKTYKSNSNLVAEMVEKSYIRDNSLSLIFAIHHAQDEEIIDEILLHTLCAVDLVKPAKLDKEQIDIFHDLIDSVPNNILSNNSVEEERSLERTNRDKAEKRNDNEVSQESTHDLINQIYKLRKNIEILSQILKNKAGSLKKDKIQEIVQAICDAGLRLISLILLNEEEIQDFVNYISKKYKQSQNYEPEKNQFEKINDLKKLIKYTIFVWTISNIEKIVSSISKPELKEILILMKENKNTPAYDLIYYFFLLDTTEKFDLQEKKILKNFFQKYDQKQMFFVNRIISLRTQYYLNTHTVKTPIKQAVSDLLDKNTRTTEKKLLFHKK